MPEWRVIQDHTRPATEQMPADVRLAREGLPTLRLFTWSQPAVSLGWKQPAPSWLDDTCFQEAGVAIVERPTGGGIAFHGSDLSWSVVMPHVMVRCVHDVVADVCEMVVELCRSFGVAASTVLEMKQDQRIAICLVEPSPYAIVVGSKKLAGMAIRRFEDAWLLQGSLLVRELPFQVRRLLPAMVRAQLVERATTLAELARPGDNSWEAGASELVDELCVAKQWATRWSELLVVGKFAGPAAARPHASSSRRTIAVVGSGRRGVPPLERPPSGRPRNAASSGDAAASPANLPTTEPFVHAL